MMHALQEIIRWKYREKISVRHLNKLNKIKGDRIMSNDRYVSPLSERYASKEMQYIFSPDKSSVRGESCGSPLRRLRKSLDFILPMSRLQN